MVKNKYYYKNGKVLDYLTLDAILHREDGPAEIRADGSKGWYVDGKLHRTDGPAIEYADGNKYWFVDDEQYTENDFNKFIEDIKALDPILQLTDNRWWVRELAKNDKR